MTWMSVDLIIRRWHWPKERLQSYRLLCKPAAVQVQSQQELWIIWVVQRFIRLLYLKRLLKSIMSEFYLWWMLYPVFACSRPQCFVFGKSACACEKTKKIGLFFHWLQIVLTIEKKKKAVQSGIQNKDKITNKFNDHIIRYKCLVLTKFTCFSWQV